MQQTWFCGLASLRVLFSPSENMVGKHNQGRIFSDTSQPKSVISARQWYDEWLEHFHHGMFGWRLRFIALADSIMIAFLCAFNHSDGLQIGNTNTIAQKVQLPIVLVIARLKKRGSFILSSGEIYYPNITTTTTTANRDGARVQATS